MHYFHLFYEPLDQTGCASAFHAPAVNGACGKLELPNEPVRLALPDDADPRLVSLADTQAGSVVLEPILLRNHQARLLLLSAGDAALSVNGEIVPRVALLKQQDQIQIAHAFNLHVAIYHQPWIGPPPDELIGQACEVCALPLTSSSRCYVCQCQRALHLEGEPHEADKLQCARVWTVCRCQRPVILSPGYAVPPNLEL